MSVNYKRLKDVLLFVVFTKVRERDLFDLMSDRITSWEEILSKYYFKFCFKNRQKIYSVALNVNRVVNPVNWVPEIHKTASKNS